MAKVVRMVKRAETKVEAEVETPVVDKKSAKTKGAPVAPSGKAVAQPARYKGATTGMRVMEFQDKTLRDNFKAKLTDEQLAELWRKEFPRAKMFTAAIVRVVRRLFNDGAHGKQTWTPEKPLHEYGDDGAKIPMPKPRESKKAVEEVEEIEEEPEVVPVKKSKKR